MTPAQRRELVDRQHGSLSIVRQCALLGVSRSSLYYRPRETSQQDLSLMQAMDHQYLETPFYGSRRMRASLDRQDMPVSRKRVQRLMRLMGLRAIYRQPRTSQPAPGRWVYPYLLRDLTITRANQVWAADITYLPMARGFLYLVAIMDWHSRYVVAWRLSNTLETGFCAEALGEALNQRTPDVFNTDQSLPLRRQGGASSPAASSPRVHADTPGSLGEDQHGRQGQVPGQHISRAAMEDGEVRGGLPEGLHQQP